MTATSKLCHATADDIVVRGRSLPRHILGRMTFTEMIYFHLTGRDATRAQTAVLDACLVTLMEHGMTPSAVATRLVLGSAPEAVQGAVAAGLLAVGSTFVGSSEGCAALLARIAAAPDPRAEAHAIAHGAARLPGFGHPLHKMFDPRTVALLALARSQGGFGPHCVALEELSAAVDAAFGKQIPVNATGAVAALIADAGLPISILRGISLISRCAGLVGHVLEEQLSPAMRDLWEASEAAVVYEPGEEDPR